MLHFAVAGAPISTPLPGGTIEGLRRAHELGIDAMEMEWVQRVPVNPERMQQIRKAASELKMTLTVHAPYYVNLNAQTPEKLDASIKRVLDALAMAELAGAISVCVHPAFYLGMGPQIVLENVRKATDRIMREKHRLFPNVNLAYETMGKPTQFGTLKEVLALSREFGVYPTMDFAHMHARLNGAINSIPEWKSMLDEYAVALGKESLRRMHIHYSGIAYGPKGEKKHLPFSESDARWQDFLTVLKEYDVGGVLVCESPIQELDTILMMNEYRNK